MSLLVRALYHLASKVDLALATFDNDSEEDE